jgi:hypothetical protein
MNRSLWYLGLLLIATGVTVSAVPTGSYSTIAGDRPVDVSVADENEGPIALVETGNDVTRPGRGPGNAPGNGNGPGNAPGSGNDDGNQPETAVAAFVNNMDTAVTVTYEASVDADEVVLRTTSDEITIQRGGQKRLFAACDPPNGGAGTATMTVTVVEANADGTTISDAEFEAQFSYDCPGRDSDRSDGGDGEDGEEDDEDNGDSEDDEDNGDSEDDGGDDSEGDDEDD